jgi:hypothetical protein
MIAALAVTMSPWWLRNYTITGRFVPTSLQVGASLYDGLSPHATGASEMQPVDEFARSYRASLPPERRFTAAEWEVELDHALREAALDWARKNPRRALRLAGVKFLRMWNIWPNAAEFQSWRLRLILAATYAPLLVLGLWGAWRWSLRDWPFALCVMPAIYFTLLHVVFVASIRYRQPAMLPLIVLAATVATGVRGQESGVTNPES